MSFICFKCKEKFDNIEDLENHNFCERFLIKPITNQETLRHKKIIIKSKQNKKRLRARQTALRTLY